MQRAHTHARTRARAPTHVLAPTPLPTPPHPRPHTFALADYSPIRKKVIMMLMGSANALRVSASSASRHGGC